MKKPYRDKRNIHECENCARAKCICPDRHKIDINIGVGPSIWAVLGILFIMLVIGD